MVDNRFSCIECPCCGWAAAISDNENSIYDGQPLLCGCAGWMSVDTETLDVVIDETTECPPNARCKDGEGGEDILMLWKRQKIIEWCERQLDRAMKKFIFEKDK